MSQQPQQSTPGQQPPLPSEPPSVHHEALGHEAHQTMFVPGAGAAGLLAAAASVPDAAGQLPFVAPAVAPLAAAGPRLNTGATGAAASFAQQAAQAAQAASAALGAQQAGQQAGAPQPNTDGQPGCAPSMPFGRSASWPTGDGSESSLWAPPDSSQQLPLSSLGPFSSPLLPSRLGGISLSEPDPPLEETLLAGNMQHISLGELSLAVPALPDWATHMG